MRAETIASLFPSCCVPEESESTWWPAWIPARATAYSSAAMVRPFGLDVEQGLSKTFVTANSRFEAFGHEVTVGTLGIEIHSTVFFFADAGIEKNVLGRRGWLHRVKVGIVDHDQLVYLSGYDELVE